MRAPRARLDGLDAPRLHSAMRRLRVIRSDRVHLKKGDVEWFAELLDLGMVTPGHYGQFGHVEANKPYYDRVTQWARARGALPA